MLSDQIDRQMEFLHVENECENVFTWMSKWIIYNEMFWQQKCILLAQEGQKVLDKEKSQETFLHKERETHVSPINQDKGTVGPIKNMHCTLENYLHKVMPQWASIHIIQKTRIWQVNEMQTKISKCQKSVFVSHKRTKDTRKSQNPKFKENIPSWIFHTQSILWTRENYLLIKLTWKHTKYPCTRETAIKYSENNFGQIMFFKGRKIHLNTASKFETSQNMG